jgi:hypothetical protein
MSRRDCLFLVADKNMGATFRGFLERDRFNESLGCARFEFDPLQDLVVAAGQNDPGMFIRGHELARTYQGTHRFLVFALDEQWEGSPGARAIREHVGANLERNGWSAQRHLVLVLTPELESWTLFESPHIANELGFHEYRTWLANAGMWCLESPKPAAPKEALEQVLEKSRIPRSSSLYGKIASKISVRGCRDPSFGELKERLSRWFPPEP